MERTESLIIQVAPNYENEKIQEMQAFGWNVHGRQEIHQEGEAYGRPSLVSSSTYVIKTKVYSYVKLHLVRSLNLPNLDRIKQLEKEYFAQSFPSIPSMTAPGCFTLFGAVGVVVCLAMITQEGSPGLFGVIMYVVWVALGVLWLKNRQRRQTEATAVRETNLRRMEKIRQEVAQLL